MRDDDDASEDGTNPLTELLRMVQIFREELQNVKDRQEAMRQVQQLHLMNAPVSFPNTPDSTPAAWGPSYPIPFPTSSTPLSTPEPVRYYAPDDPYRNRWPQPAPVAPPPNPFAAFGPPNALAIPPQAQRPNPFATAIQARGFPPGIQPFGIGPQQELYMQPPPPAEVVNRTILIHPNGRTTVSTVEEKVITDPVTGGRRYETTTTKHYSLDGRIIRSEDDPRLCPECERGPFLITHACTVCGVRLCPRCITFRDNASTAWREPRCDRHNQWVYDPPKPPERPEPDPTDETPQGWWRR